ncbi:putative NADH dehydrogenase [ubiquinone] 1 alpha subcomplex subunit 5, partial [Fragariocoptes setiger]
MASKVTKLTTGITGLLPSAEPHRELLRVYSKLMRALSVLPEESKYRKHTEPIIKNRINIVETTLDVEQLEDKINCGQVEELIEQAKDELSLAKSMAKWRPWRPLDNMPPENQWKWPI